jgi:hypothetical protein
MPVSPAHKSQAHRYAFAGPHLQAAASLFTVTLGKLKVGVGVMVGVGVRVGVEKAVDVGVEVAVELEVSVKVRLGVGVLVHASAVAVRALAVMVDCCTGEGPHPASITQVVLMKKKRMVNLDIVRKEIPLWGRNPSFGNVCPNYRSTKHDPG